MEVRVAFELDQPVDNLVIGLSLRGSEARVLFGANTALSGGAPISLDAGPHACAIRVALTVPPQECFLAVGLAHDLGPQPPGKPRYVSMHRIYDQHRIRIEGSGTGPAWCETRFVVDERAEAATQPAYLNG